MNSVEIIKETRDAYSNPANRAGDGRRYRYMTGDGKKCAVGRCLVNPDEYSDADGITEDNWDEFTFKSEYQGQTMSFWQDLQAWHDTADYFTETEISEKGETRIQELIAIYK